MLRPIEKRVRGTGSIVGTTVFRLHETFARQPTKNLPPTTDSFGTNEKPSKLSQAGFWIRTTSFDEVLIAATALTPDSNTKRIIGVI
jgi:hypothetical protein